MMFIRPSSGSGLDDRSCCFFLPGREAEAGDRVFLGTSTFHGLHHIDRAQSLHSPSVRRQWISLKLSDPFVTKPILVNTTTCGPVADPSSTPTPPSVSPHLHDTTRHTRSSHPFPGPRTAQCLSSTLRLARHVVALVVQSRAVDNVHGARTRDPIPMIEVGDCLRNHDSCLWTVLAMEPTTPQPQNLWARVHRAGSSG